MENKIKLTVPYKDDQITILITREVVVENLSVSVKFSYDHPKDLDQKSIEEIEKIVKNAIEIFILNITNNL